MKRTWLILLLMLCTCPAALAQDPFDQHARMFAIAVRAGDSEKAIAIINTPYFLVDRNYPSKTPSGNNHANNPLTQAIHYGRIDVIKALFAAGAGKLTCYGDLAHTTWVQCAFRHGINNDGVLEAIFGHLRDKGTLAANLASRNERGHSFVQFICVEHPPNGSTWWTRMGNDMQSERIALIQEVVGSVGEIAEKEARASCTGVDWNEYL